MDILRCKLLFFRGDWGDCNRVELYHLFFVLRFLEGRGRRRYLFLTFVVGGSPILGHSIQISGLLNRHHHRPRKRCWSYRRRHSGVIVDVLLTLRNHSFPSTTQNNPMLFAKLGVDFLVCTSRLVGIGGTGHDDGPQFPTTRLILIVRAGWTTTDDDDKRMNELSPLHPRGHC